MLRDLLYFNKKKTGRFVLNDNVYSGLDSNFIRQFGLLRSRYIHKNFPKQKSITTWINNYCLRRRFKTKHSLVFYFILI